MKIATILVLIVLSLVESTAAQQKPNVIIFLADDYGWADVGYRNPDFYTPNIDKLKSEGIEFTRAYVGTPTCSPSRASLLTGKEAIRLEMPRHINEGDLKSGKKYNYWPKDPIQMPSINYLPLEEVTYAERLHELGYYNMFLGKWHLGTKEYFPIYQGFDDECGVTEGGMPNNYYQPFFNDSVFKDVSPEKYLTDVLTDKAVDFILGYKKDKPFNLSLWHYAPHSPHVGRKDLIEKYKAKGWQGALAEYGAMVSAMDESLGRIRQALNDKGIEKNTIILFTSDQGSYFTNFPLRGGKTGGQTLCEGGARVPFIIYYPGITTANTICNAPIQTIDVFPTLVEIASGEPCNNQQIQGISLLPLMRGGKTAPRNLFFYRSYEDQYTAIIQGEWKLIKFRSGIKELYNIKNDTGEVSNLIFNEPKIATNLSEALTDWEKEAVPVFDMEK